MKGLNLDRLSAVTLAALMALQPFEMTSLCAAEVAQSKDKKLMAVATGANTAATVSHANDVAALVKANVSPAPTPTSKPSSAPIASPKPAPTSTPKPSQIPERYENPTTAGDLGAAVGQAVGGAAAVGAGAGIAGVALPGIKPVKPLPPPAVKPVTAGQGIIASIPSPAPSDGNFVHGQTVYDENFLPVDTNKK